MSPASVLSSLERRVDPPAWYALYTRHQHEKTVSELLFAKGFDTFLPLYSAVHRWKDREKRLLLPLYPGYVFLHDRLDRRLQVVMTPGIHSIVGRGGIPEPIPDYEIEAVKRILASPFPVAPHLYLQSGDRVRIIHGPLEGLEGILVRKKNAYRLILSVEMLKKSVAVEVDATTLEPVSEWRPSQHAKERILPSDE